MIIVIGVLFLLSVAGSIVDYCLQAKDKEASDAPLPHRVGLENGGHTAQQNLYGSLDDPKGDQVLPGNQFSEKSPLLSPHHSMVTRETVTVVTSRPQSLWTRLIVCFAFSRNIPKLLGTKQGEGGITCLNGIRVISMSWVILGHTLALVAQAGVGENLGTAFPAWLQSFSYQAILNAYFSVDSFFFLSGLLITYLTLKKMKESAGKIPWKWIYLHRYLRLTPALAMLILVFTFILPDMSQGPIWHSLDQSVDYCRSWWWTNILYINNFFPPSIMQNCVMWTWYLANDMQFFLISPLIIIPLFWYPAVGVSILSTLCIASFITTAVLVEQHGFQPGVILSGQGMSVSEPEGRFLPADSYMDVIYTKPYCRIPPYLVGMAMGYIIYRIGTKKIKLSPIMAAAGWAVAAALGMTVVYGLYPIYSGSSVPTTATSMAYTSLSTFTWGVALCWVVFACHYGYGGVIHDFLSWSLWVPLSRMTYSAYLLHPLVMYLYAFSQTVPIHWSTITVVKHVFIEMETLKALVIVCR
ncbi:nose resistant to fluoxetine protein 6-like [Diadema antillarum]|uniref:nose resistant to fluoxetine protein 6-like n=1 Tax=Diadema antillarum TaxID=105358 RepID=UPI003A8A16F1